jgi:hypothetical protein
MYCTIVNIAQKRRFYIKRREFHRREMEKYDEVIDFMDLIHRTY